MTRARLASSVASPTGVPVAWHSTYDTLEGDTEQTLAARILIEEHRCYPKAVQLFAEGRVRLVGEPGQKRARIESQA